MKFEMSFSLSSDLYLAAIFNVVFAALLQEYNDL